MSILKIKKIFTYVVVGALVIALSISCSNEDTTGSNNGFTHSNHPLQGTYVSSLINNEFYLGPDKNAKATVENSLDGTCHITGIAYYDTTDSSSFDITITKWYQFNGSFTCYAGSLYEQSEATINSPSGVDFTVTYDSDNGLNISFGPSGKRYSTYSLVLVRQQ